MVQLHGRVVSLGIATVGLLWSAAVVARGADAIARADNPVVASKTTAKAKDIPKPKRQLSPELSELRDRVRGLLAAHAQQPFNTRDNVPTEIMSRCLAFGCATEVALESPEGQHINGITCLCWNYPCAGFEIIGQSDNHLAARIGYGYQHRPGELLATLAFSRVPAEYPVRLSGRTVRKVADLVEAEKLACRRGGDLSSALVGLSYYVNQSEWKNSLGETWSIERIVEEELNQPAAASFDRTMNRLIGLSYALAHQTKHNRPITGDFERARKYVADFERFALRRQNSDGSWGPNFPAARVAADDSAAPLRMTSRMAEWLALSLPQGRLEEPGMVGAINYLSTQLGSEHYQWNTPMLSTQEIISIGHALHALATYDEREFRPTDEPGKPAAQQPAATSVE
ncbi:MAG: hypothetical protein ABFC63_06060 [Thermoguttaceae bacterium]